MSNLLWHLPLAVIKVHINQWIPNRLQRKMTEKRVIREVHSAYYNVPLYKEKYDKAGVQIKDIKTLGDLKKLPYLTKDDVRNNFPKGIVARGVDIKECHYSATTGSTGRSLPFIFNAKTYAYYLATSLRVYTMIGYRPWHKMVYIKYTAVNTPAFGPLFRSGHVSSILPVKEQIVRLREEKPDLLIGYASLILEIARNVTDDDMKHIRPKFISVNSELSTQDQRDFISAKFGCPVYDEYSTEETWMIASQCRNGKYHIFTDNVWVEFLDKDGSDVGHGEIGEVFLTTTRSPAMPFIRYKIDDMGRPGAGACACGIQFPVLESFEGRADDSYILPSGKFISSLKLLNTFTMYIKKYLYLIEEFKMIQKEKGLMVIQLIKGTEYKEEQFQGLINQLHSIFGEPVTIKVEFVDKIPGKESIKRKAIESWVKNDKKDMTKKQTALKK